MALKILIADDSMTAQNMGKKILVGAGYDIVLVSNGAAAIKKIAEQKPDIVILDIYMPGYNGLEVCERVKNARETAKLPVLLTVGKMEPYRAEDGAKVRADGIIIKPFEASDLLAAVAKLAEMVAISKPPSRIDAIPAFSPEFSRDMDFDRTANSVQVPESVSSAPAMMDELFTVSDSHFAAATAFAPALEHGHPASFSVEPGAADFDAASPYAPAKFGQSDIYPFESLPDPSDLSAWEAETIHATEQHVSEAVSDLSVEPLTRELEMPALAVESEAALFAPAAEVELGSAPTVDEAKVAPPAMLEAALSGEEITIEEPAPGNDLSDFSFDSPNSELANPDASIAAESTDSSPELDLSLLDVTGFDVPASEAPVPGPLESASSTSENFPAIESYDSMMELLGIPEESTIQGLPDVPGGGEPEALAETPGAQSIHVEWAAEETAVLPGEVAALLEQEMETSTMSAPVGPAALPDESIASEAPPRQEVAAPQLVKHAVEAHEVQTHELAPTEAAVSREEFVATETPVVQEIAEVPEPVTELEAPEPEAPEAVTTSADEPVSGIVAETVDAPVEEAAVLETNFDLVEDLLSEESAAIAAPLEAPVDVPAHDETSMPTFDQDSIDEILHPQEPHVPECHIEELVTETAEAAASAERTSSSAPTIDASRIAAVVQSVFERHKEQIIAEIIRELSEDPGI